MFTFFSDSYERPPNPIRVSSPRPCVPMTQSERMLRLRTQLGLAALFLMPALAQNLAQEDYHVYRDAPRITLTQQRRTLLERERSRQSLRWEAFDAMISSEAPLPEPGFALALYYRASRQQAAGRRAIEWALGETPNTPALLRQLAIVLDWCGPLLTPSEAERLAAKIQQGLTQTAPASVTAQAARALAAIALADKLPDAGDGVLRDIAVNWWGARIAPELAQGRSAIPRNELYAFFELLHAIRDNTRVDLREAVPEYFRNLPLDYIAGHYPAALAGPENDFRVPVYVGSRDPDANEAALSRAAGFAMVAYDTNALNQQYVQGFLLIDRFLMRGAFGAPYEFLWANPYQPGLSYRTLPMVFHDPATGHVFARTSWDEDGSIWIGYFDGTLQVFRNGIETLRPGASISPVRVGPAVIAGVASPDGGRLRMNAEWLFVLGLSPSAEYGIEIDDQELDYLRADVGGTLVIQTPEGVDAGVRIVRH